jgi:hypothetical protein
MVPRGNKGLRDTIVPVRRISTENRTIFYQGITAP